MKRLTLRLSDDLYRTLRIQAAQTDQSVHQLAITALESVTKGNKSAAPEQAFKSADRI